MTSPVVSPSSKTYSSAIEGRNRGVTGVSSAMDPLGLRLEAPPPARSELTRAAHLGLDSSTDSRTVACRRDGLDSFRERPDSTVPSFDLLAQTIADRVASTPDLTSATAFARVLSQIYHAFKRPTTHPLQRLTSRIKAQSPAVLQSKAGSGGPRWSANLHQDGSPEWSWTLLLT